MKSSRLQGLSMIFIKVILRILIVIGNNHLRIYTPIIVGSVLASLFTVFALSVNVSAQDAPDFLLGNLTLEQNPTKEQTQEAIDKVQNYTSTMLKAANGNQTKLDVLLIEDLAKRNIIDEDAKQGFLSFIAKIPKPSLDGLPGTIPGNLTDLDASSALLDEIAKNNSDSQPVSLMTSILKKRVGDLGNGTDVLPFSDDAEIFGKAVVCAAMTVLGGNPLSSAANAYYCYQVM